MRNNDKLTRDEIRANIQQAVKDGDTELDISPEVLEALYE